MPEVLDLQRDMFPDALGLFKNFDSPRISDTMWTGLLDYAWRQPSDPMGYVLADGKKIVGILSTVFSTQEVMGHSERFCNMSSWYVEPDYRNQSSQLLM